MLTQTRTSILALGALLALAGCATSFPRPGEGMTAQLELTGDAIFARTVEAHGGRNLEQLTDLNTAIDGRWKFLITRIQPLVTDHRYRVRSEERIDPVRVIYAVTYSGPAGTKQVFRNRDSVRVWYDGIESQDADVLASTALTADSFLLFSLGPLSPLARQRYERLPDAEENGRTYHRIHATLSPGLGFSQADELVLWVDAETNVTYRVHITLEGFRTTQGAHVDVTFLDYAEHEGLLIPIEFNERVRGPIAIEAHRWWVTGLDTNRGWQAADLNQAPWTGATDQPASPLPSKDAAINAR